MLCPTDGCAYGTMRNGRVVYKHHAKCPLARVSARKYMGDDRHSWAVFIDGRPFVTGLGKSEVNYYKLRAAEKIGLKRKEQHEFSEGSR